jgi:transposase
MPTRGFCLSQAEANELSAALRHCRNADTKIRYQAVRLYGLGHPVPQILDICGCSRRSLLQWSRAYREGGIAALVDHRKGGNRAKLGPQERQHLQQMLHQHTPAGLLGKDQCTGPDEAAFWNITDLARLIEPDFGVVYRSTTSYYSLLAECAMSYQRPAKVYKSHSAANLMAFEQGLEKKAGGRSAKRARDGAPGR